MRNREESFAQTNSRIVQAAIGLHAERGVLGTSWQEIAERAGVSPVTVYRHFRSLSELIPACARSFVDSVAPLAEEDARAAVRAVGDADSRRLRVLRPRTRVVSCCDTRVRPRARAWCSRLRPASHP